MQTDCKLIFKNLNKKDINKINLIKIVNDISSLKYDPKLENISTLKSNLTDIFFNNGFILDKNLGSTHLKINGIKHKTGLAIQTGNAARFYADLLKLQWLYEERKINNVIYVCLSKNSVKNSYLSNLINSERAEREINFFDKIIKVPILLIGIDFLNT